MKQTWMQRFVLLLLTAALLAGLVSVGAVSQKDITLVGDAYYDEREDCYVLTEEETWQGGSLWFSQIGRAHV